MTPNEVLVENGLDWLVTKEDLFWKDTEGNTQETPDIRALVREDTKKVLSIVSSDWEPVQNFEAFEFFNEFVKLGHMSIERAGSLKNDKVVYCLARVEDAAFEVVKGDRIDPYFLFTNFHMYGHSTDIRFTPSRFICSNMMQLKTSKASNYMKYNHRRPFDPDKAREIIDNSFKSLNDYKEKIELLVKSPCTEAEMSDYFGRVFGVDEEGHLSRTATRALEILDTQPGAEYGRGTWWHALNTVTYLTDNVLGRSEKTRTYSSWYGPSKVLKERAMILALEECF